MQTLVIVPTYNEAANLPELAPRLLALEPPVDVLIVDDDSPDGTGRLADEFAGRASRFHVLHRTADRGYARSCIAGLQWALSRDYDTVCTMDADLSHDPDVLPRLVERVTAGDDLAIGSRYVEGGRLEVEWGPVRRAISRMGSAYARAMTGAAAHDCTSGFRCYRRAAVESVRLSDLTSDGYSFLIEMLAALTRNGARVSEYPITYVDRRQGQSKISGGIVREALVRTTAIGIRRLAGSDRETGR